MCDITSVWTLAQGYHVKDTPVNEPTAEIVDDPRQRPSHMQQMRKKSHVIIVHLSPKQKKM